jgi:2-methylisocitrate lyase-like PEP mutase family enzyme
MLDLHGNHRLIALLTSMTGRYVRHMTPDQRARGERFRALHEGERPLILPNPWDVGSARLFAQLGFAALATTGGGLAFSLGLPDGSTTPEQLLAYASEMAHATDLPVTADLEDGFADSPDGVRETMRRAAELGVVGASIEDRSYAGTPRRPGLRPYDVSLAAERVAAAVDAADSLDAAFTVTARCENYLVGRPDLEDTIRRLRAYQDAGAHCLYAPGLPTLADVRAIVASVDAPVNVLIGRSVEPMTVEALAEIGVRRISVGSGIQRTAIGATMRAAQELLDRGSTGFADDAIPHAEACALFAPWSDPTGRPREDLPL